MTTFVNTAIYLKPESEIQACKYRVMFTSSLPQNIKKVDVRQAKDTERFRTKASSTLTLMIKEAKNSAVKPTKLVKKVAGGC